MKRIANKQEFYKLSRRLLLGNILNQWTWDDFVVLMAKDPNLLPKVVGVRHVRPAFSNKGISGLMRRKQALDYGYSLPYKEAQENILIDEGAVHDRLTIQGEVMPSEYGLYLRYSFLKCHQRTLWHIEATGDMWMLEDHQMPHNIIQGPVVLHAFRMRASALLQKYMDAASWEKLNEIFNEYLHPVVEFACFTGPIGKLGWNTLFWEVRTNY